MGGKKQNKLALESDRGHETLDPEWFQKLLIKAWETSRLMLGSRFTVHVPGMFVVNGRRGKYRAVSITGERCDLNCLHCNGTLLRSMPHARDYQGLLDLGLEAERRGDHGMLVSGGCDQNGCMPWKNYLPAIRHLKTRTSLKISVHCGIVDSATALGLKEAGVDQALLDVIGDDLTAWRVCHLGEGVAAVRRSLEHLSRVGLEVVPHVIYGLDFGKERGELGTLTILKDFNIKKYVIVVLVPTSGTGMATVQPPPPERVAAFIARARLELPGSRASLGCARPRGKYMRTLDVLAVQAGINAMALPSDAALGEAEKRGLTVEFEETCCSLS